MTALRPEPGPHTPGGPNRASRPLSDSDRPPPIWRWPQLRRLCANWPAVGAVLVAIYLLLCTHFPSLLYLVPLLYYFFRSARLVAWRLSCSGMPPLDQDRAVTRVKNLRKWTAPAVSLANLASFGTPHDVLYELLDSLLTFAAAPWLLVVTAPVVTAALILSAAPDKRGAMRAALRGPLRRLVFFLGTSAFASTLFLGMAVATDSRFNTGDVKLLVKAGWAAAVWIVLVFLFSSVRVIRAGFGLHEVHPALPALLTTVLVWECAALGGLPAGPPVIAYALLFGGPAMVTAIAGWEIHRLHTWYGATLRRGRSAV